jgi:hypothetical protein
MFEFSSRHVCHYRTYCPALINDNRPCTPQRDDGSYHLAHTGPVACELAIYSSAYYTQGFHTASRYERFVLTVKETMLLATPLFGMSWLPAARANDTSRWVSELNSKISLDPVSLITLFFDSAEKDLLDRTGDMTLLSCFGLFVHPRTVWNEYVMLHPSAGLTYYNPEKVITSTVEVRQVNAYLTALASKHRDCGIVVRVKPLDKKCWWPNTPTREWLVFRPCCLAILVCIAIICRDAMAVGAVGALLIGQSIAIVKSVYDGQVIEQGDSREEQTNIFFLANRVTAAVKCKGGLFYRSMSSPRGECPVIVKSKFSICVFSALLSQYSRSYHDRHVYDGNTSRGARGPELSGRLLSGARRPSTAS